MNNRVSAGQWGRRHLLLLAILLAYGLSAGLHALASPPFESWDEPWHYPMVQVLATQGGQLPIQDPANPGPYRQQGSQPPLYYYIVALATAGIDQSDMQAVRRLNPHAGIGVAQPDGNHNLIVHPPGGLPWRGAVLALMIGRAVSILMGAGTVLITYALARLLFPDDATLALGATALMAFLPMFAFLSASVSNDAMANLLGNGLTLAVVRLLHPAARWRGAWAVGLGVLLGASLLTKLSLLAFAPAIGGALIILSWRAGSVRPLLVGGVVIAGLAVLIGGWWYWRNWQLYGDPTALNVFLDTVGRRIPPPTPAQLWAERVPFARSYWGAYGSINLFLPTSLYALLDALGVFSLASVGGYLAVRVARRDWDVWQWMRAGLTLGWCGITFVALIQWTTLTPGSQGRLLFVALSSVSIWMAVGLSWWWPRRWRWVPLGAVAGLLLGTSLWAPGAVIAPAYAHPPLTAITDDALARFGQDETGVLGLAQARIAPTALQPGEVVRLDLTWQMLTASASDYSLYVHLVSPEGIIVAQRDTYPGGGRLATSDIAAGQQWQDVVIVPVPRLAYAPQSLTVRLGWYDVRTGQRLAMPDPAGYVVGTVELAAHPGPLPNPLVRRWEEQIDLLGYELDVLSAAPGEAITLTLYWRRAGDIPRDYVVFAQIIDPVSLAKQADSNAMPANWARPTTTWQDGEIIADAHTLAIYPSATPGIYDLQVGLYWQDETGRLHRLRLTPGPDNNADDFIRLNPVRVLASDE